MKKLFILIFSLLLILTFTSCSNYKKEKKTEPPKLEQPDQSNPPIVKDTTFMDPTKKIYAVMIDNISVARPQSGISKADIIYEALAEGGIPRLMAVFNSSYPEKVGPIRSARPYFVYIAKEMNAHYVHVGGSDEALKEIKNLGLKDYSAMFMTNPFFIDKKRSAPHNTYISLKDLSTINMYSSGTFNIPFNFSGSFRDGNTKKIVIPYNKSYVVEYRYDTTNNHYYRFVNGKPFVDREDGSQLYADNVIIQYAKHTVLDKVGRLRIDIIGKGKAEFFINKEHIKGYWQRDGINGMTKFYDENGKEIKFYPGKTWVQIVPDSTEIEVD